MIVGGGRRHPRVDQLPELDTGPASLYVYVDGSRGLRDAMFERVIGSITFEEPDPSRWRQQVVDLMKAILRALQAHPGIARVLLLDRGLGRSFDPAVRIGSISADREELTTLPSGLNSLRLIETLLGMLHAGGIDAPDAVRAMDVLSLITAAAAIPTQRLDRVPESNAEEWTPGRPRDALANLPPDQFPLVTSLVFPRAAISGEERFTFAIETFLDGLVARRRGNK
jgi:AcrR family transcriptional regulator